VYLKYFRPSRLKKNIIKAVVSIVQKTHWAKHRTRMWVKCFASKHRKSQFDMNMTVVLKSTKTILIISNFLTIVLNW